MRKIIFFLWLIFSFNIPSYAIDESVKDTDGIAWGAATNSLIAGLAVHTGIFKDGGTAVKCYIYVKNISTNDVILWAPKPNQRFHIVVTDDKKTIVNRSGKGKKLGEPLEPHPVFSYGTKEYIPSLLRPDDQICFIPPFSIYDYFDFKSPGKYTVELGLQLYRVATNNQVSVIAFPKVKTDIVIDEIPRY